MTDQEQIWLLKDEIATLKGNIRRITTSDMSLLKDAYNALSKGKTYVTKDHLERVIESQQKMLREIG